MRYKIIATISLVAVGGLASGCSRNKPAVAPTPAASDRTAADAAAAEAAKLREEADRAAAAAKADADRAAASRAQVQSTLTTPVRFEFDRSALTDEKRLGKIRRHRSASVDSPFLSSTSRARG